MKGLSVTCNELGDCVNDKPSLPGEDRPELSLSRRQLRDWLSRKEEKTDHQKRS